MTRAANRAIKPPVGTYVPGARAGAYPQYDGAGQPGEGAAYGDCQPGEGGGPCQPGEGAAYGDCQPGEGGGPCQPCEGGGPCQPDPG
jgi:hypothetical protein